MDGEVKQTEEQVDEMTLSDQIMVTFAATPFYEIKEVMRAFANAFEEAASENMTLKEEIKVIKTELEEMVKICEQTAKATEQEATH